MQKTKIKTESSLFVRTAITSLTLGFLLLFIVIPVVFIFKEAFSQGFTLWVKSITDTDALEALKLTLTVAFISVPLNTVFGMIAAWALSKFRFPGRDLIITLVDLPFAVSPVVAGLVFVLLFGSQGWFGPWLSDKNIQILFSLPGIVLATIFVTFPFVARELIPLMTEQGIEEEQAALTLGAGGLQTFFYVTLPNIKWGLFYGVILCNARAMGEFGAVSVVSGHIRGKTNTLPLHTEILYNEYNFTAAFAVASVLAFLAIITLVLKSIAEFKLEENKK